MLFLETLPGWPEAEPLSGLFYTMLLFGGPVLVGLVVAAFVYAKDWAKKD